MPIYEYICDNCHNDFSVYFSYAEYNQAHPACASCGSLDVHRKIGSIRTAESGHARLDRLKQDVNGDASSQALGKVIRSVSDQAGLSLKPEYKEVISRLERGESRASIDRDYD